MRESESGIKYRPIGDTNIKVSELGLGTEYLCKQSRDTILSVVEKTIENGINYFDLVFNFSDFLESFGEAIDGYREEVVLATHLGSLEKNANYKKSRDLEECEGQFYRTLSKLNTDYTDVVNIHYVLKEKEYDEIIKPDGLLNFALRLKEEDRVKVVCISTHEPEVGIRAAENGNFDLIMIQVNISNNAMPCRDKMLSTCDKKNVGVIAMKPFAGGKLLEKNRTVRIAKYQRGGDSLKKKIPQDISPIQCLNYCLSQIGVVSTVPGVKNIKELDESLYYLKASQKEKDYSSIIKEFDEYITGQCVYCNHCLPCPSDIDIGKINRLVDTFREGDYDKIKNQYASLSSHASDCIECEKCIERCPFDVDVISIMKEAVNLLEKT